MERSINRRCRTLKSKIVKSLALVILLVVAAGCAYYSINEYLSSKSNRLGDEEVVTETKEAEFEIANVASASDAQPSGYGVEREITGELKTNNKATGVGGIDFSGVGEDTFQIIGKLAEDKELIQSMIEKENKVYTSTINWTYGNISVEQYKALIVACGAMYEDELNNGQGMRYTVEASIPPADSVDEMGIEVLFDVDEEGYLTLWADIITRDSVSNTEVEEIKSFTLYYTGNVLTFKK